MSQYDGKLFLYCEKSEFAGKEIEVFDTREALEKRMKELHAIKNKTNQPLTEFAVVFEAGTPYPTDPDLFYRERRDRRGRVMGWYVVRYKKPHGRKHHYKRYEWKEDAQYLLQRLQEQSIADILVLHVDEGSHGDYYYNKNIAKIWG